MIPILIWKLHLLELMLALLIFVIVTRWVPGLHTLRVLGCVWQGQQLLLKLRRDIDTSEVSGLCPDSHLCASLIAKENALLLVLHRMHPRNSARIASSSVNSKGPIDIATGLVKLNGLPSIFSGLTDTSVPLGRSTLVLLCVALHLLLLNVPLYLILTEPEWQI